MSQGLITAVELASCRVPKDPASPVPAQGYVVACRTFYERGFDVSSYQVLRSYCSIMAWNYIT
jgi:hypothetical protein